MIHAMLSRELEHSVGGAHLTMHSPLPSSFSLTCAKYSLLSHLLMAAYLPSLCSISMSSSLVVSSNLYPILLFSLALCCFKDKAFYQVAKLASPSMGYGT